MNSHDVGRGRGGVPAAPRAGSRRRRWWPGSTPTGCTRCEQQEELARASSRPRASCQVIDSPYGHDGFLLERDAVAALVGEVLVLAEGEIAASRDLDREERAEAC